MTDGGKEAKKHGRQKWIKRELMQRDKDEQNRIMGEGKETME